LKGPAVPNVQYLDAAVKAFHDTDTQLAASLKQ
jgi:hypothetical protein